MPSEKTTQARPRMAPIRERTLTERLALAAAIGDAFDNLNGTLTVSTSWVERFAQLVAEECAKAVEMAHADAHCTEAFMRQRECNRAQFAAAIRAKFGVKS